ncbi:MAG: nitroreductase family protein [Clostridiales bacterium]|jgi:nitroreductase|nr:nitroreductase family protein [Eubacteriales bacterium]MDH7566580.1 nitroreductase family protein [Clostridiales bacterium]
MEENEIQLFDKPITEVIRARRSIRAYKKQPLPLDIRNKLEQYFSRLRGPFHANIRFSLIDKAMGGHANAKLGTYGVIRGASTFIVPAVEKSDHFLVELGYELEKLILYAASLDLGTCWLGGTFKKGEFAKAAGLKENEMLPVVSPVGFTDENGSFVDSLMRMAAGSKHRKGWGELFFNQSLNRPLSEAETGTYSVPLEMLRLAPSASNKQPWRIVKEDGIYHLYLQRTREYGRALGYDIQKIDMGIAICHFDLTAKESGLDGGWHVQDPGLKNMPDGMEYVISWVER